MSGQRSRKQVKKPDWQAGIAKERIKTLLAQAELNSKNPAYSRRYVELLRKIAMRYTIRLPKSIKRRFCKNCNSFFTSENSSVRTSPKQQAVIVTCKNCGSVQRFPYRKEKA